MASRFPAPSGGRPVQGASLHRVAWAGLAALGLGLVCLGAWPWLGWLWPPSLAEMALQAAVLSDADQAPRAAAQRHLVAVTGALRADTPLGDPGILRPGDYIEIWRQVEVFCSPSQTGAQKGWIDDAADNREDDAAVPLYEHPLRSIHSDLISAPLAWVGPYRFSPAQAQLLAHTALYLVPDLLDREDRRLHVAGGRLYVGAGTPEQPLPGDVRISYFVVQAGPQVTLLGELAEAPQGHVVPAFGPRGRRLYHVLPGSLEQAVIQLQQLQRLIPHSQRPWAP